MIDTLPPVELDLAGWLANMRREGTPKRVFNMEHAIAEDIQQAIDERFEISKNLDASSPTFAFDRSVSIHRFLGMEFFRVFPPGARTEPASEAKQWAEENKAFVTTWEQFDAFPWLDPKAANLSVYEHYEKTLPQDMRVFQVLDLWEAVRDLIGFETVCYKIFEDPDFVEAMFLKVGEFNVAITEEKGEVIFLRKIVPGGVDKSYGIHVAQLAGLPKSVVHRANEVLAELEEDSSQTSGLARGRRSKQAPSEQLSFFGQKPPLLEELEKLDIESLSPLEALTKLYELQKKAREE